MNYTTREMVKDQGLVLICLRKANVQLSDDKTNLDFDKCCDDDK